MKPTSRDLMVARAVRDGILAHIELRRNRQYVEDNFDDYGIDSLIESLPEPAEPEQAAQDADDEDWLGKLVRENGGEVELFTRAQVDAARAEGARAERERCLKEE